MCCKVIIKALADTSLMSHNYHFFFVVRTFKIYSLSNFQVYNIALLAIITELYIRSSELIHLKTGSLHPLTKVYTIIHTPPPLPSQTLASPILLSFCEFNFLPIIQVSAFVFLCLTCFT